MILMADDDPAQIMLSEAALAGAGFVVHSVGDGAEAVEQFDAGEARHRDPRRQHAADVGHRRLPRHPGAGGRAAAADPDADGPQRPAVHQRCVRRRRQRLRAEGHQPAPAGRAGALPAARPRPAGGTAHQPLEAAARAAHRARRPLGARRPTAARCTSRRCWARFSRSIRRRSRSFEDFVEMLGQVRAVRAAPGVPGLRDRGGPLQLRPRPAHVRGHVDLRAPRGRTRRRGRPGPGRHGHRDAAGPDAAAARRGSSAHAVLFRRRDRTAESRAPVRADRGRAAGHGGHAWPRASWRSASTISTTSPRRRASRPRTSWSCASRGTSRGSSRPSATARPCRGAHRPPWSVARPKPNSPCCSGAGSPRSTSPGSRTRCCSRWRRVRPATTRPTCRASAPASHSPAEKLDAEQLLQRAHAAAEQAAAPWSCETYSPVPQARSRRRLKLESVAARRGRARRDLARLPAARRDRQLRTHGRRVPRAPAGTPSSARSSRPSSSRSPRAPASSTASAAGCWARPAASSRRGASTSSASSSCR